MKKLLAMIILVCMFALGLAGCGGSNSEVTEPCLTFDAYGNGCLIVEESNGCIRLCTCYYLHGNMCLSDSCIV